MAHALPSSRHHFPKQAMPFVGRNSEIAEVVSYLADPDCRLLTLIGFGGIGKTRLAIEATSQFAKKSNPIHRKAFPDGLYFVDLAPLTSNDLLATTIADKLDITVSGATTLRDQLLAELEQKKLLLLLDNFEHIMSGKSLISDILAYAPHVTLLVTSRERLNVPEECGYEVQGMVVPQTVDIHNIEDYSALLLFQQIAQKVDWYFTLDEEQLPHVVRICRLVQGIPLAIEMAAAWVRVLSCREIAEDLTYNFELLEATLGHVPERHQSIRAAFDYSWNLLTEAERLVFQKMSVFRGGFRREAAEQITGATIRSLLSLVDQSLLQHNTDERYQIHELLRQFAEEKLAHNQGETQETYNLHCTYYADFLDKYQSGLETGREDPNSPIVVAIDADIDNVRVMWNWAITHQRFDAIYHASDSLYHYHRLRETHGEAVEIFQKAVVLVETADPFEDQNMLLAKLLSMLAYHAKFYSLDEFAETVAQQGLTLARTLDIPDAKARCLVVLGDAALDNGQYTEARHYLEESVAIYETLDEIYEDQLPNLLLALSYKNLGEYDLTRQYYHQLISTGKKRKSDGNVGWALTHLGYLDNALGHYAIAQQHCAEAVEIFDRLGVLMGMMSAHKNLAHSYCGLGQYDKARHHFRIALIAYIDHGMQLKGLTVKTFVRIAHLFALEGDVARAVELTSFVQQNSHASNETQTLASTLSDELKVEIPSIVFQSAQDRGINLELELLVTNFIEEFTISYADEPSQTEAVSKHELELLQQVTEGLLSGELFDENLSEKEQGSVQTLVDTVDTLLEHEKSKIMTTFMESASHDLRTPLTVINTSLYLLERMADPDKQKNHLKLVKEQVTHLQTLIENLITMARLDGEAELDVQPHDLNQLITAIQQTHMANLTDNRDLDVRFIFPDEPQMVMADIDNLQSAILNIIENAVRYTLDGGTITVKLHSDVHNVMVDVRDTGIGIEADDLPHVFERFYRVDKARTERGRSGLGLAITQKIIDAHHGYIEVVSTPNNGSTFRVVLPRINSDLEV